MASTVNDCLALYGPAKGRTIVFCETKKECNGTSILSFSHALNFTCL